VGKNDDEHLNKTLAAWQPRASRELTREDARQIVENVTGFFKTLLEWDATLNDEATTVAADEGQQHKN
jgi:hypothetical protein